MKHGFTLPPEINSRSLDLKSCEDERNKVSLCPKSPQEREAWKRKLVTRPLKTLSPFPKPGNASQEYQSNALFGVAEDGKETKRVLNRRIKAGFPLRSPRTNWVGLSIG